MRQALLRITALIAVGLVASALFESTVSAQANAPQSAIRAPDLPSPAATPSERPGALSYGTATGMVKKGVTTQVELLELFGGPSVMTADRDGTEIWMYDKTTSTVSGTSAQSGSQATQSEASSFAAFLGIPFFAGVGGSNRNTNSQSAQVNQSANTATRSVKTITFIIKFNQDRTVKDYSVRQASY